eukprot:gene8903-18139_t
MGHSSNVQWMSEYSPHVPPRFEYGKLRLGKNTIKFMEQKATVSAYDVEIRSASEVER